ncbi:hypothetical protein L228DRAFT_240804 [Xylona heveae TC161]|uniref:Uncharacterized protein n=1 Tax=Xylona heveae (strain CBS 132557 / TC161) TaxID=1328760 RepID=A0A165ACT6_XYLHT|nr:hypothetical protein L228DRAFT_240804 [Xylona heveae TC161]KZF20265.1 hypothetical protein L228DRAFT_240804 [Xylona heveae TC161]
MGGRHGRTGDDDGASMSDNIVNMTALPSRPPMVPSASAPVGQIPRLPLQDISQYAEESMPSVAVTASSTSLAELAHLVKLQNYQEQRRAQSRVRLHRWLVSSALSARLERGGELAHRSLIENFRSDDKKGFAALYNAIHDVRSSCDALRRYALLEPEIEPGRSMNARRAEKSRALSTFMHELPSRNREEITGFLSKIRTDPDFLAGRIASLSSSELSSLTAFHQALDPIESVMPISARGKPAGSSSNRGNGHPASPVGRLLSFQRHDPLSALLYTVFANSSGPDSAEDLRRTEIWATTCARLITDGRSGSGQFICSVLNAWAAMREWPGKTNLELYLMKMLQEGAFLLDKADEQQNGTRTQPEGRSSKDLIAAEEFFDMAIRSFFEVIDDEPSAGGIPEGVLEIGNAIIKKLDEPKKQRAAQTFISHGIMTGHHISEYARQRILKEIAIRAQKQVLDMTYNWKQAVPIHPEIRAHIESILLRFRGSKSTRSAKPMLHPAKAITSPRETVEIQPYLVICPSDIVTLVNTLFPERRLASRSLEKEMQRKTLHSTTSSISGISVPLSTPANSFGGPESVSILSNSSSSVTSDVTSREPLLESFGQKISLSSLDAREDPRSLDRPLSTEEYGQQLRLVCSEMTQILGLEATAGVCHPCAEKWAILFVSGDGKVLNLRMRKDSMDDDEEEEDSFDSDSEDEGTGDRGDLERDYHQLKHAITRLVEEYEIPKELTPDSESKIFSNRTTHLGKLAHKPSTPRQESAIPVEARISRNPYHAQSQLSAMIAGHHPALPERSRPISQGRSASLSSRDGGRESPSVLLTMLEAATNQCRARADFIAAHLYWKTLQQLRRLPVPSLKKNGYAALLNYISRGPRDSLGKSASAIEEFEAWFVWLKQSQERHDAAIEEMMLGLKELRDKMWYVTDVRNSAGYEEAKNIALALKTMGQPAKPAAAKATPPSKLRHVAKSSTTNFLFKTEAQILDLMTASTDQGGPNKLSDEQAEMTLKWLTKYGIENFCKGEERIHRFCLEVDKCVDRLVGERILDGPVLWSSELFSRDQRILDSGRQKGDLFLTGVGTLSIAGDEEYVVDSGRSKLPGLDLRSSSRDLRSISARNTSQQSFDSGRWSTGRGSGPIDLTDSQDYFGNASPVLSIDSSNTFWSPFRAQLHSAATTGSNIRQRAGSSTNDTAMLATSERVNLDKHRFLLDLKQTLTGLLLSDLGNLVWSKGSETDAWFTGDLGEECRQRKEEEDRKRRKALAKKKSMRSMRKSEHRSGPLDTLGRGERSQPAAPVATLEHAAHGTVSAEEGASTSSSDATARSSGLAAAKKAGLLEFPFNIAFRQLLRKFSTHPNPYTKLHALYELELLIVASLASRSGRSFASRRDLLPTIAASPPLDSVQELQTREATVADHSQTPRAKNLEEAIANCEERRSQNVTFGGHVASPNRYASGGGGGSNSAVGVPSTDMIVDVLQSLFRDSDACPKTLFRDLQYIASFVPAQILDKTERGKAFWDAGLAALGLKQDVCRTMVEIADDIVGYHTKNRGSSSSSSTKRTEEDDEMARFSMEDAGKMWIITAKEGDPVAERELAIFYLTHPDLLLRTTLPLTMPKDTFKAEMTYRRHDDPIRSDPQTMCVAFHWMELSSQGGDKLARKYLRAREEFNDRP